MLKEQEERNFTDIMVRQGNITAAELANISREQKQAINQFHYWMTHYNHRNDPENAIGNNGNKNKLLEWLYCDSGAGLINNYAKFTELSQHLARGGYNVLPAALEEEYNASKEVHDEREENNAEPSTIIFSLITADHLLRQNNQRL